MLESILNETVSNITMTHLMICSFCSILLGVLLAAVHQFRNHSSKSFLMSIVLLPVIVQMIIMLVNGNLGTGVAVMGAFSLVRFRSMPGNAREISSIFLAMAVGLATGMGYLGAAFFLVAVVAAVTVIFLKLPVPDPQKLEKDLRVTIPENLDYHEIFDDIFRQFTTRAELIRVKTVNMGSLYELEYSISLKQQEEEKAMLDAIRCRNGNLTIVCGRKAEHGENL